jgi:peroxiredoxin Q/BCP
MTNLQAGQPAPELNGADEQGNPLTLASFQGKKLVLFFYPKDDTPGCTAEACSLRDAYADLRAKGYELLGVSPDTAQKHKKFKEKHQLPFPLLVDNDQATMRAYGVWGPKKFMGRSYEGVNRTTFVIDENGVIAKVIDQVDTKNHADQVLAG